MGGEVCGKQKAGTGYTLTIKGKNTISSRTSRSARCGSAPASRTCSGSSGGPNLGEQSKTVPASAKNPNIRLMTLKRVTATTPQDEFPVVSEPREGTKGKGPKVHWGKWLECEPDVGAGVLGRRVLLRPRSGEGAQGARRADRDQLGRDAVRGVHEPRSPRRRAEPEVPTRIAPAKRPSKFEMDKKPVAAEHADRALQRDDSPAASSSR